ncbi:MAG: ribosome silencing factor [Clostridium sp.]|nr:MAG: ribosome silencing factor [Clostridium sp.]
MNSEQLAERICFLLDEKKATDITVMKVGHLTIVADYFCHCDRKKHGAGKGDIRKRRRKKLSKGEGLEPLRVDGTREGRWIVMDYGGVIVHIFNDDTRVLYCLDKLWSDGNNVVKYESK